MVLCEYMCRCACTWWGQASASGIVLCQSGTYHHTQHPHAWVANTLCTMCLPGFFYLKIFLCIWAFYRHICICITLKPGAQRSQKRALDSLKMEGIMSHQVGTGIWAWVFGFLYFISVCGVFIHEWVPHHVYGVSEQPLGVDSFSPLPCGYQGFHLRSKTYQQVPSPSHWPGFFVFVVVLYHITLGEFLKLLSCVEWWGYTIHNVWVN